MELGAFGRQIMGPRQAPKWARVCTLNPVSTLPRAQLRGWDGDGTSADNVHEGLGQFEDF